MTEPITITDIEQLPAMSSAELKVQREYLGLSTAWIADKLVIGERRIQRMENGQEAIPDAVVTLIDEAQADAKSMVEQMVAVYRRTIKSAGGAPALLPTYRTDKISEAAGMPYPSRFYRHVAARVADAAAGAIVMFGDQIPGSPEVEG